MSFPNPRHTPGSVFSGSIVGDSVFFDDWFEGGDGAAAGGKFSTGTDEGAWLCTLSTAANYDIKDGEPNGVLFINGASTTNQGVNMQLNGEGWLVRANKDIYFETRIKTILPLQVDMAIGLFTTDTGVLAGTTNAIGFGTYDTSADLLDGGSGDIYCFTKAHGSDADYTNSTTILDTGVNLSTEFVTLAFHVIGNRRVKFYVDGNEKASFTTNIPIASGDAMTLTMAMLENGAAGSPELMVDYIYCAQVR